jgi:hypothetical protein
MLFSVSLQPWELVLLGYLIIFTLVAGILLCSLVVEAIAHERAETALRKLEMQPSNVTGISMPRGLK